MSRSGGAVEQGGEQGGEQGDGSRRHRRRFGGGNRRYDCKGGAKALTTERATAAATAAAATGAAAVPAAARTPAGGSGLGRKSSGASSHHVQLNKEICKAADDRGVRGILDVVATSCHKMSCVNLSTALHRLGSAHDNECTGITCDRNFLILCARTKTAMERQVMLKDEVMPRCWATIAWSFARLQMCDDATISVLKMIAELSMPHLSSFKPFELTNLLWAFVKSQAPSAALFVAARKHVESQLDSFSRASLSTLVWIFVSVHQHSAVMLRRAAERFSDLLGSKHATDATPVELANMMWGLATSQTSLKRDTYRRIGDVAAEILPQFKTHELTIFAWSFSRLNVRHDWLFQGISHLLCGSMEHKQRIHPQGIANLMWAFAKQVEFSSAVTKEIVEGFRALVPTYVQLFPMLKPQELCSTIWAATKLGCCDRSAWNMEDEGALFATLSQAPDEAFRQLTFCERARLLEVSMSVRHRFMSEALQIQGRLAALCRERLQTADVGSLVDVLEASTRAASYRQPSPQLAQLTCDAAAVATRHIDHCSKPLLLRLAGVTELPDPEGDGGVRVALVSAIAGRLLQLGLRSLSANESKSFAFLLGLEVDAFASANFAELLTRKAYRHKDGQGAEGAAATAALTSGGAVLSGGRAAATGVAMREAASWSGAAAAWHEGTRAGGGGGSPTTLAPVEAKAMLREAKEHGADDVPEEDGVHPVDDLGLADHLGLADLTSRPSRATPCSTYGEPAGDQSFGIMLGLYVVKNTFVHLQEASSEERLSANRFLSAPSRVVSF